MPITARLSRTLHDALGDEAAADLVDWMQTVDTHRAELRELNELNYARLDSRMTELRQVTDARFGELRHELRADISTLRVETQAGFAEVRDEMRSRIRGRQSRARDYRVQNRQPVRRGQSHERRPGSEDRPPHRGVRQVVVPLLVRRDRCGGARAHLNRAKQ